jgi:diguanylate cyclase (GGDEF)-like protein/PAS domain S-box-containing protein
VSDTISCTADDYEALVQFLYLAPVGLVQTTGDGAIVMINPISAQLLMPLARGGDLTNLFGALERVAPDLRHRLANFDQPHGLVCDGLRVPLGSGHAVPGVAERPDPQVLSISLLKLDESRLMAVLSDVSERVRRERLLRQSEAWLNAVLTGIADYALIRLDRHGKVDEWNPSIGRVTGFGREAVLGQSYAMFHPADGMTGDRVQDLLRDADDNGWSGDDGWRVRADGTRFWASAMISALRNRSGALPVAEPPDLAPEDPCLPDEPGYCLMIRDITDQRDASESRRRVHACDQLTGIANRRSFFEAAERELSRARRAPRQLSLILFEADHVERVNDSHGHPAGDAVLQHLAALLTATFREVDLVARIGGEEFAVLLPSTGVHSAALVAERLRAAVASRPVEVAGRLIHCTVSAGIATTDDGATLLDALIKRADIALHEAKAAGRNRIVIASTATAAGVA